MEKLYKKISIIGAGTWGVAIASHLCEKASVELTHYRKSFLKDLNEKRVHPQISDFKIPKKIKIKHTLNPQADLFIVATPVQHIRSVLGGMKLSKKNPILILSKGIEQGTLMFPSDIVKDVTRQKETKIAILSGPSHAEEVLKKTLQAL